MSDFKDREKEILDFWDKNQTFQKSVDRDAPQGDYLFYDGPPFATGTPHYGHLVASIMKDVVPRFWTMNGYRVERKWGWDVHGLPIENIVEKDLGFKSKKDIEAYGVDKFNENCRSRVLEYADIWKGTIRRLGRWVDMENDYKTMDLNYMETIWWVFKELWNNDLIYEDYRSMHICPRCETTLSQSEVAEGYKDVKDLSLIAKFELADEPGTYVLAWTTTPWTLIGNVALAVGKDIDYVKVESEGNKYILAKDLIAIVEGEPKILAEFKGKDLVGKKYKPLFPYYEDLFNDLDHISSHRTILKVDTGAVVDDGLLKKTKEGEPYHEDKDYELRKRAENVYKIYAADFVTTEEGTGVVHIAPAFGEDDMNLGKKENLPSIQHVSMDGIIDNIAHDFAGLNVKPKDDVQSTDVEIIKYLAGKGTLFAKEKYEHSYPHCWRCDTPLLNYATSSWFVNVTKIKDQLLENAKHINWVPDHIKVGRFGNWLEGARDWSISRQRFWGSVIPMWVCDKCGERKIVGSVAELKELSGVEVNDLHKHVVDKVTFACSCGGTMVRIPDVLDCWFESGSMPYAQSHYPFENEPEFDKKFPAKFIAEGADQTRAWFYYLHVIAGGVKHSHAFANCIVNGIVLAEDGKKMAKKLKNYPEPDSIMEKYGADALRMYLLSSPVMLAENFSFTEKDLSTVYRKFIVILQNVLNFYLMFSGDKKLSGEELPKLNNDLDKWIVSKLVELHQEVTQSMKDYNLVKATRPIFDFVDALSTWYVRRSRDRFKDGDNQAIVTLAYVLKQLSKIIAPFSPMTAELIYQEFANKEESVHLEMWPEIETKLFDKKVLEQMDLIRNITEVVHALRAKAGIKVRQPLAMAQVEREIENAYKNILAEELNVEQIESVKEVKEQPGWEVAEVNNFKVALDTNLTDDLKDKGTVRELIRFINALRKDAGLNPSDRPVETYQTDSAYLKSIIEKYKDEILANTSADTLEEVSDNPKNNNQCKVNGEDITLGLKISPKG